MEIVMAVIPNEMETSETLNGLMVGSKFCWIFFFVIGRFSLTQEEWVLLKKQSLGRRHFRRFQLGKGFVVNN